MPYILNKKNFCFHYKIRSNAILGKYIENLIFNVLRLKLRLVRGNVRKIDFKHQTKQNWKYLLDVYFKLYLLNYMIFLRNLALKSQHYWMLQMGNLEFLRAGAVIYKSARLIE